MRIVCFLIFACLAASCLGQENPDAAAKYESARECYSRSNYGAALADINEAIAISSNHSAYFILKGNILMRTYHKEEALAAYQKALKLDPKNKELKAYIKRNFGKNGGYPATSNPRASSGREDGRFTRENSDKVTKGCIWAMFRVVLHIIF
jgi:tetratricopeptide (TPR) repeat protein